MRRQRRWDAVSSTRSGASWKTSGAEVEEITSGEHARYIARMTAPDVEQASGSHAGAFGNVGGRGPSGATKIPGWLFEAQDWVGKFQQFWGAGGGMSQSAGSTGHRVVLEVGHLFGAKFQPWGAVRVSERTWKRRESGHGRDPCGAGDHRDDPGREGPA